MIYIAKIVFGVYKTSKYHAKDTEHWLSFQGFCGNMNGNPTDDFPLNINRGGLNILNQIYADEFQTSTKK